MLLHKTALKVQWILTLINQKVHTFCTNVPKCALRWIADACVIDGLQFLNQYSLGILDVAEGDGTLAEVALSHLRVDDLLYQSADALFRIVRQ